MLTYKDLQNICEGLPEEIKLTLDPIFQNIVFETKALDALRKNPKTLTSAAMQKTYRSMTQTLQQDLKLVLWQLRNNEADAADELLARLSDFE